MKRIYLAIIAIVLAMSAVAQNVDYWCVDGRVYFKINDDVALNISHDDGNVNPKDVFFLRDLIDEYQISNLNMPFLSAESDILQRIFRMDFEKMYEVDQLVKDMNNMPEIEYAEKAPLFRISMVPNDPYYGEVSGGGLLGGTADANWHLTLIGAEEAWDLETGDSEIVVAVLDNAIDVTHPDLQNKIVSQIDLGNGDSDPSPPEATYIWSHGTHGAGLIAAETNNGVGVASIGYDVSLMAVKLGDDASDGQGMAAGFEGIVWAADNGADVINMSWGSPQFFITMQHTVNYAYNKGCVMVGAAGNNGNGMETQMNPDIPVNYIGYPAALEHVIAVGSCDVGDNKSDFSNYGTWLDVLAPGGYYSQGTMGIGGFTVLSTTASEAGDFNSALSGTGGGAADYGVEGQYDCMRGTSVAASVTAGLCGLILSANPDLTPEELTSLLKSTCVNVDAENFEFVDSIGAGRINAHAAIQAAIDANAPLVANFGASEVVISVDETVDFTDLTTGTPTSWTWTFEGGMPATSTEQNPMSITYDTEGVYQVSLEASDGTNTDTEIKTAYIIVSGALLEADFTWTGTPCSAGTITFTDASVPDNAINWEWYISGPGVPGGVLDYSSTFSHNFPPVSTPTDFDVSLYVNDGTDSSNITKTITIYPLPDVVISPIDTTVCEGEVVTLTANGGDIYEWSTTESGQSINPTVWMPTTYTVTGTDTNGCVNIASTDVSVNLIDTIVTTAEFCEGSTFNWNGSDYTMPGTYYYTTQSLVTGCDSTCILELTVNPLPQQVVVLQSPSNGILTSGNTGEISLSTSQIGTVYWVTMGAALFTAETAGNGTSLTLGSNYPAGTYDVWSSNAHGCDLLQGSVTFVEDNGANKLTANITFGTPATNFPAGEAVISLFKLTTDIGGEEVIVLDDQQTLGNNGQVVFEDIDPGDYYLGSALVNPNNYNVAEHVYYQTAISHEDAISIPMTESTMFVADLHHPQLASEEGSNSGDGIVGEGGTKSDLTPMANMVVILRDNDAEEIIDVCVTNASGEYSFPFIPDNTNIQMYVTSFEHQNWSPFSVMASTGTNYTVDFVVNGDEVYPDGTVGSDLQFASNVCIYPNPTSGMFSITGKDLQQITITDLNGKIILEKSVDGNKADINLNGNSKAVYLIKVVSAEGTRVEKIVLK